MRLSRADIKEVKNRLRKEGKGTSLCWIIQWPWKSAIDSLVGRCINFLGINLIILYPCDSKRKLKQVLTHELVHAYQFKFSEPKVLTESLYAPYRYSFDVEKEAQEMAIELYGDKQDKNAWDNVKKLSDIVTWNNLKVYTDASPAPIVVYSFVFEKNEELQYHFFYIPDKIKVTSNEAEYLAILQALHYIGDSSTVTIYSDSRLAIKQLNEEFKINFKHLQRLWNDIWQLCFDKKLKVTFVWIPRNKNLAGIMLDKMLRNAKRRA